MSMVEKLLWNAKDELSEVRKVRDGLRSRKWLIEKKIDLYELKLRDAVCKYTTLVDESEREELGSEIEELKRKVVDLRNKKETSGVVEVLKAYDEDFDALFVEVDKLRKELADERGVNLKGFVALRNRDDVRELAESKFDFDVLRRFDDLIENVSEYPYEMDEDIVTLFGTNKALYEKLMTIEEVARLVKKSDFYVCEEGEFATKLYYMNYNGNTTDKKYLKEYLKYNETMIDRDAFENEIRFYIEEVDEDYPEMTLEESRKTFDDLVKWW